MCIFAAVNATEIKTIELLQCNRQRDYPNKDYPLFEYVNKVANHFWLPNDPFEDDYEGEELSYVPYKFAKRYLSGKIDISRLPLYQEAVTDGKSVKQHHGLDDDVLVTPIYISTTYTLTTFCVSETFYLLQIGGGSL